MVKRTTPFISIICKAIKLIPTKSGLFLVGDMVGTIFLAKWTGKGWNESAFKSSNVVGKFEFSN